MSWQQDFTRHDCLACELKERVRGGGRFEEHIWETFGSGALLNKSDPTGRDMKVKGCRQIVHILQLSTRH